MITSKTVRAAVMTAAVFGFAAAAAQADECETITRSVKVLIDRSDPAKSADNPAGLCAAYAEGLGLIKSLRIVVDECLDEGDLALAVWTSDLAIDVEDADRLALADEWNRQAGVRVSICGVSASVSSG